jgi:hypothetical protein
MTPKENPRCQDPRCQRRTKIQETKKGQNLIFKKAPIFLRSFTGGFGHSFWSLFDVCYLIFLWHLGVFGSWNFT